MAITSLHPIIVVGGDCLKRKRVRWSVYRIEGLEESCESLYFCVSIGNESYTHTFEHFFFISIDNCSNRINRNSFTVQTVLHMFGSHFLRSVVRLKRAARRIVISKLSSTFIRIIAQSDYAHPCSNPKKPLQSFIFRSSIRACSTCILHFAQVLTISDPPYSSQFRKTSLLYPLHVYKYSIVLSLSFQIACDTYPEA